MGILKFHTRNTFLVDLIQCNN